MGSDKDFLKEPTPPCQSEVEFSVEFSVEFRSSLGSGSGSGGQAGQPGQHSEQQAVVAIEKAYSKPVAFSVRTNVMYDGTLDDDSPVHGCAVRSVLTNQPQQTSDVFFQF